MKRIDGKFLLLQALILVVVGTVTGTVVGVIISIAMSGENPIVEGLRIMPFSLFAVALMHVGFGNFFTGKIAKKTMEKHSKQQNFGRCSTFITDGSFTIGGIVKIDEGTGRIAYVSYQNPYEFQMVQAKDITRIKSDYIKAPLGGTQYVYFEFYYNEKRVRIPTFTASNVYSLQSEAVLEGISKADAFCDLLKNAQQIGAFDNGVSGGG